MEDENWTKGLEMVVVVMVKPIGKGEEERKGKEKHGGFGKVLRRAKMTADFYGIVHPHLSASAAEKKKLQTVRTNSGAHAIGTDNVVISVVLLMEKIEGTCVFMKLPSAGGIKDVAWNPRILGRFWKEQYLMQYWITIARASSVNYLVFSEEFELTRFCHSLLGGVFAFHGFSNYSGNWNIWLPFFVLVCALLVLFSEAGLEEEQRAG
ncbi:hypothetical protein RHSIM_Rhsim01G0049600 [Rhododendron simsii]|uniref:Uncharacterized protein n=1 Tax=Rhododendron simsii TaxID=118357 RepID=A0A834HHJ6_RHOSS|nr:hypothetical protein RHSIM_Rhsim01G0049600 [Rhododendron simsii]